MNKFSIILPVKNGGHYVKECIASILGQSLTDFNLVILDNKSTDGTLEWVQSIQDSRIKIYTAEQPLTIEENWARILAVPKNEFMTLIGHDDLLEKDYLETMNELVVKYPGASLYQTHFKYIDEEGKKIRDCKPMPEKESAEEFLSVFLKNNTDVMGTGFMMRAKDYDVTGGIPLYPNLLFADFELWITLAAINYKVTSPKNCFSFRLHRSTTRMSPDTKFHEAFERFIFYLEKLKNSREGFKKSILENGTSFLLFYCKSLSHRLLRTATRKRGGLTVKKFINKCKTYSEMLGIGETFRPGRIFSIRLAGIIDSNFFGRILFLGFKRIFPGPVLK